MGLAFGQSGANGRGVTPHRPIAQSSDSATATMLPPLLLAMATQLRRLHAHQMLAFGQSGANGRSATPHRPIARSSDSATATMLPPFLLAMATQLRRLHAHQVIWRLI